MEGMEFWKIDYIFSYLKELFTVNEDYFNQKIFKMAGAYFSNIEICDISQKR